MASRDVCSMCGGRIGLSEESMQNDVTLRLAHARCVHAANAPINPVPREVKLPPMQRESAKCSWCGLARVPGGCLCEPDQMTSVQRLREHLKNSLAEWPRETSEDETERSRDDVRRVLDGLQEMRDALFEIAEGVGNSGDSPEDAADAALKAISAVDASQDADQLIVTGARELLPKPGEPLPPMQVLYDSLSAPDPQREFLDAQHRRIVEKLMELKNRYHAERDEERKRVLHLRNAVLWIAQTVHQGHDHEGLLGDCKRDTCSYAREVLT